MDINQLGGSPFPWYYISCELSRETPYEAAAYEGNGKMLIKLMDNGATPKNSELNAICRIHMFHGEIDYNLIKELIQKGADVDGGKQEGDVDDIPLLTVASLLPLSEDYKHYDKKKAKEIVKLYKLIYANCKDKKPKEKISKATAIDYAAYSRNTELIKYLVEKQGYSVNERDSEGETCLISVTSCWDEDSKIHAKETVELLLSYGAEKEIKDNNGKTAYDYAKYNKQEELAKLLKP